MADEMIPADEELLAASRFRIVRRWRKLPSGKIVARETIQHTGAVAILPIVGNSSDVVNSSGAETSGEERICLIRNYRVAVRQTLVEVPAGTLEPGEDPAECAARELIEETGYRAGRIEHACDFFMSPGILNEKMHLFLAYDLALGETALEEGEEIERLVVSRAEALRMAYAGEIQDAKSLVALLWYAGRNSGLTG